MAESLPRPEGKPDGENTGRLALASVSTHVAASILTCTFVHTHATHVLTHMKDQLVSVNKNWILEFSKLLKIKTASGYNDDHLSPSCRRRLS